MAITFVILQISLCIVLTMAQQPASSKPNGNWLYEPNSAYILDPRNTSLPCNPRGREVIPIRHDYTYTSGIGAHKFHTTATTWNNARKICQSEGAHLAIVNSAKEAEVISNLFEKSWPHVGSADSNYAHAGFHDLYNEGEFVTIHDESLEKVGFYEWADGEPNNCKGNENCGSLYKNGKLNDIGCAESHAFVCELSDVK